MSDHLTEKLYRLLGDKDIPRNNLCSNRAQISWQSLAMSPERAYAEREVREGMYKDMARKASQRLPVKTSDNPFGRDFSIYAFIFGEDELLTLMHHVYELGVKDARPPVTLGKDT